MTKSNRPRVPYLLLLIATLGRTCPLAAFEPRTIDGSDNNLAHPNWGRAGTPQARLRDVVVSPSPGFNRSLLAPAYEDGMDAPRGMTDVTTPRGRGHPAYRTRETSATPSQTRVVMCQVMR